MLLKRKGMIINEKSTKNNSPAVVLFNAVHLVFV